MDVHTEFVNKIIIKRRSRLIDLLDGNDSLNLSALKPHFPLLWKPLDRVFYTLNLLEKEKLILVEKQARSFTVSFLNGFDLTTISSTEEAKYTIHYFHDKLKEMSEWEIEALPGLFTFKNNGYKTDAQLREDKNFWLAILIAILSPILTVFLPKIWETFLK